jgi:hypothetical protein
MDNASPTCSTRKTRQFHDKHTKPIGGFWTLSKVLEVEPLVDETLREFVRKLNQEFVEKDAICMIDTAGRI